MKNFEKQKTEAMKVLSAHPHVDLHASELVALREKYINRDVLEVIGDLWLIGLAAGYRLGLKDGRKDD